MAESVATSQDYSLGLRADLSGQVAIVTGASQGLGRAIALALAANDATVACVARTPEKLAETVHVVREAGGKAEAFAGDVSNRASVESVVDAVYEKYERLDILVNNAGITRDTLLPRMSDDEWEDVIRTNLSGAFYMSRAASRIMMRARRGRIINISSVSGLDWKCRADQLLCLQGGLDRDDAQPQSRVGGSQGDGKRSGARFYRERDDGHPGRLDRGKGQREDPQQAVGPSRRCGGCRPVFGERCGRVHYGAGAYRGWRHDRVGGGSSGGPLFWGPCGFTTY